MSGPMYDDLENPSAAVELVASDISDWPSYSPKRYERGLRQIARVRAELDALERTLLAEGLEEGISPAQLAHWRRLVPSLDLTPHGTAMRTLDAAAPFADGAYQTGETAAQEEAP